MMDIHIGSLCSARLAAARLLLPCLFTWTLLDDIFYRYRCKNCSEMLV